MSGSEGPILAQRIVYTALALLFAAILLSLAVSVLESIWPWLLGIGLVIGMTTAGIWWHRRSRRTW
jgi:hypothetical protein